MIFKSSMRLLPVKKNDIFNKGSKESSELVKCSKFFGMKHFLNLEPFSQITVLHLKVVPQGLKCNPCIFLERGRFPGSFTNYYLIEKQIAKLSLTKHPGSPVSQRDLEHGWQRAAEGLPATTGKEGEDLAQQQDGKEAAT